ncbi:MAG: hypothetical protein KBA66_17375 [Leptospiraceae bacterium]|nr:hypothetical protein [Leptospiraceae bacterium]
MSGLYFSSLLAVQLPLLVSPLTISDTSNINYDFDKGQKKNSKKIPTSWGANTLSQETKQVEGIDVTAYSLSGGAWILHKTVKLSASSIEILGEDAYKGYLKGQTKVEDPENGITLTAGKGTYDKAAETILLDGRPTLIFKDKEQKITKITAPYLKRYIAENKTVFEGGAIIENGEYTIYSEKAIFLEKEESLLMENYPYIFGKNIFLTGEKVTYSNSSKNTTLENDTILLRLSYESKSKKSIKQKDDAKEEVKTDNAQESSKDEKEKRVTIFTGEKLIYQSGDDDSRYVGMFGNAKMNREDYEFTASYIKAFGKNNGNIEAKEAVVFLDKENHVRLSGDTLEHNKETEYTHLTDNAIVEFLDKENTKVNSTLTSVEVERFGTKKEIVSRGDVNIVSEQSTIKGEYATYFEETEKMYVEGNPSLRKDDKVLYCGRIIVYPNLDKIILTDGLNVNKK